MIEEEYGMRRTLVVMALAVPALVRTGGALAHEGHEHKIMGKVVMIAESKIEVELPDGKKVTGALSAETKYIRDKAAVAWTDVKVGERVVIVVVEDKSKIKNVKRVLLGAVNPTEGACASCGYVPLSPATSLGSILGAGQVV